MPELNICYHRLFDKLLDYLWTPSIDGNENLEKEGVGSDKVTLVGNIMIDSLVMAKKNIEQLKIYKKFGCSAKKYGLVTLHRPSNVDDRETLQTICHCLKSISEKLPLIFPVHPRTSGKLSKFGIDILKNAEQIHLTDPQGYNDFMNLVFNSQLIITDSGGVQEETTYLQIPCITLRANTERPITVSQGSNQLCKPKNLFKAVSKALNTKHASNRIPELWDGKTAERIVQLIKEI